MTTKFDVLTLHTEMVKGCLHTSVLGRAVKSGILHIGIHDIRDAATDKHRTVDDSPYGGGAGMVMKVDIVSKALAEVRGPKTHVIMTSPAGRRFTQTDARRLLEHEHVVFLCGHYEGIDARIESLVDEEFSLGDFVMTGGEIAAAAMVDATARLIPGVLGNHDSALDESFTSDLLEYPHFTRPRTWEGRTVPEVLMSGHHGKIERWRLEEARKKTAKRRPDLWATYCKKNGIDPTSYSDVDEIDQKQ